MRQAGLLMIFIFIVGQLYSQTPSSISPLKTSAPTTILYRQDMTNKIVDNDLSLNGVSCRFTKEGLVITGNENVIQLNRYYSLGERLVRYHVKFSQDAKAVFKSNTGDFKIIIDVPGQTVSIEATPTIWRHIIIRPEDEYLIEIRRNYQQSKVVITNIFSGENYELEVNGDGSGGVGVGAVGPNTGIVHQWDYYCFGLLAGASLTVKQVCVQALMSDLNLLLYGDSQTQPEGYFPAKDFPSSWTQLIIQRVKGKAMSSGRGGCTIREVLERIKNELPYVKARYVMVTIGTNGGNTEENLSELIEYIIANGSVPILNNIPSNEHGTQVEANLLLEKVRRKYHINGCRFDVATSINHDGKEVDKTTMWHEDYTAVNNWGHYYHHPNVKGSSLMFIQTLIDTPEIYQ